MDCDLKTSMFFQNHYFNQNISTYLETLLKPIKGMNFFAFNNLENNIPSSSEIKPNSLIIFDDVACHKQNVMREYFSMGRHKNIDCFYLCQTYTKIPKQLIRDNANFLIVFF
jgi:hypothetical protein